MSKDRWVLLTILMTWIVAGAVEPFVSETGDPFNVSFAVHTLVLAVLVMMWCTLHAQRLGVNVSKSLLLIVLLLPLIGVPYYHFSRFGWKSGAVKVSYAIGFLVVCVLAFEGSFELSWRLIA